MNSTNIQTYIDRFQNAGSRKQKLQTMRQLLESFNQLPNVQSLALGNKQQIINFLDVPEGEREIFAPLCPIYSDRGIDVSGYEQWNQVPGRFQIKADRTFEALSLLYTLFPSKINLILADKGIMLDKNINQSTLNSTISDTLEIYQNRANSILGNVPFNIKTFSDLDIPLDQISAPDASKSITDCQNILETYAIDSQKFQSQLNIIIDAFGPANTFNLINNYLKESEFLMKRIPNTLFLNAEFCRPLNSLYTASGDISKKLNQKLLFAPLNLTS